MTVSRRRAAVALLASIAAIVSCSRSQQGAPRAHPVSITNFAFAPSEVTVARGDTVVWTNADFVPHTATARDSTWNSGSMAASATWRFVTNAAGRYEYFCELHPGMRGTIVVR